MWIAFCLFIAVLLLHFADVQLQVSVTFCIVFCISRLDFHLIFQYHLCLLIPPQMLYHFAMIKSAIIYLLDSQLSKLLSSSVNTFKKLTCLGNTPLYKMTAFSAQDLNPLTAWQLHRFRTSWQENKRTSSKTHTEPKISQELQNYDICTKPMDTEETKTFFLMLGNSY